MRSREKKRREKKRREKRRSRKRRVCPKRPRRMQSSFIGTICTDCIL